MSENPPSPSAAAPPPVWRRPVFWIVVTLWVPVMTGVGWLQWRAFTRARERREEKQRVVLENMRQRVVDNAPPAQLPLSPPAQLPLSPPAQPPLSPSEPATPPSREGSVRRAVRRLVGVGEPQDYARAVTALHIDAQLGNADAMALLADALLTGDPKSQVPADRAAARKWLEQAALARNAMVPQVRARLQSLEEAEREPGAPEPPAPEWERARLQEKPDETPVVIKTVRPDYPLPMRYLGITGEVMVDFIVDAQGKPRNVTVVRSSHAAFAPAATDAVARWMFRPALKGGRPVSSHLQVPVRFSLNDLPARK